MSIEKFPGLSADDLSTTHLRYVVRGLALHAHERRNDVVVSVLWRLDGMGRGFMIPDELLLVEFEDDGDNLVTSVAAGVVTDIPTWRMWESDALSPEAPSGMVFAEVEKLYHDSLVYLANRVGRDFFAERTASLRHNSRVLSA